MLRGFMMPGVYILLFIGLARILGNTCTMTTAVADKKMPLRVKVSTDIDGLQGIVQQYFALSPLAGKHELILEDLKEPFSEPTEILLADPGKVASLLDLLHGLKWLQSTWAGINAFSNVKRRDFTCTRLAGCMGHQMSEYVFGAIFSDDWFCLKQHQDSQQWVPAPFKKRTRLGKMTLGCLGVGDLASVIAESGRSFGMRTIGFASRQRPVPAFDEISTDLAHILSNADVIVSVLPSTPLTRGLLDGEALSACGEGKLFINVGRGDVVSEESLLVALSKGWLKRAVLDVFVPEPLPTDSKLWSHPAVQLSPHISAISYPDDIAKLFVENLALWVDGKDLRFTTNLDQGY